MIVTGANIAQKDDPLTKIKVEYLYHKIRQPNAEIEARIRQLRIVKQLDPRQYSHLKRQLPYVVCGIFNPLFRRTENFAYTEYFILDIDKIEEKGLSLESLRQQFQSDSRVMLCFESPGNDGLKIMFRLAERCYDASVYSIFYKAFALKFASEYSLEQVIDARTSDVARACFVSMDPLAYYNPIADPVDMKRFVNLHDSSELLRQKKGLDLQFPTAPGSDEIRDYQGPDAETMNKIKSLLKTGRPQLAEREVIVPPQLDELMEGLSGAIAEAGVVLKEVKNIQYGKKIIMSTGLREAEVNLFFGKKGFSVVQSGRRGTNEELNKLMAGLIEQYIAGVT